MSTFIDILFCFSTQGRENICEISSPKKQKEKKHELHSIFSAAKEGTVEDVRYFVERKNANVNTRDEHGNASLHYATGRNKHNMKVVQYLISQGADVHAKNCVGNTPLQVADTKEKKRILREAMQR